MMENKYKMTKEQNIFVAKRNLIDYIWKDANLEGIAITYPDTEAVFNGFSVKGYKVNEIIAVNNLKRAWHFLLDNIDYPADYQYMCKVNQLVGGDSLVINAGYLRETDVRIGGTNWRPEIPKEDVVIEKINEINKIENPTDRALTMMFYGMRSQLFLDGNKRTSMLAANQIMISNGAGVIAVPIEKQPEFTMMLVKFYETGNIQNIKSFVYEHCIDGMEFPKELSHSCKNGLDKDLFIVRGDELEP